MGSPPSVSRRAFLGQAGGAMGSGWLASQWPLYLAAAGAACSRRESGAGFARLDPDLALALEAVAEQIIPADDSPGAGEAGVVWFIDQLLDGPWSGLRAELEAGARALDERSGPNRRFAALAFDEQTAVLKGIEGGPFFSTMQFLTLAGMFAMPARGGNRGKAGWRLIGFDDRHAWQPPFGHYDAVEPGAGKGGGAG